MATRSNASYEPVGHERQSASLSPTYYGTCATAAATGAKVVECPGFTLTKGARVAVKFTNSQTYNATTAAPLTLNVNNTGAVPVMRIGTTVLPRYMWQAGPVVEFVYDGTNYTMIDGGLATTTYYGITK